MESIILLILATKSVLSSLIWKILELIGFHFEWMKTVVLSLNLMIEVSRTLVRAEASKADLTGLQVKAENKNEFL